MVYAEIVSRLGWTRRGAIKTEAVWLTSMRRTNAFMVVKLTVVVLFYVALIMHPSKYMTSPVKVLHESTIASALKL